jgi:hypothetical protein
MATTWPPALSRACGEFVLRSCHGDVEQAPLLFNLLPAQLAVHRRPIRLRPAILGQPYGRRVEQL